MQLILLSGGSGKRLWPLSNNFRSKQFLCLLEREDGSNESMVQRVVRQAKSAGLTQNITIATNSSQFDIIKDQLGDSISIITEPERRDTFPAIALVASYLKFTKHCSNDEVVAIMPCDPYTDIGYFETIGKMVDCVKQNTVELVLMGITPTYASEKYGYIIPEHSDDNKEFQKVSMFTEKPNLIRAKELIAEKAYWNAGVFAFRLDYIMNIVNKYINPTSFDDVRIRYSELPKISFDYEVTEKAASVAVVPFNGQWNDLGTWNAITEKLNKPVLGNAVIGPHCENTHVINELQYPIYVDGLKNIVVAACTDGILVCDKQYSEGIKNSVECLIPQPICKEQSWGTYCILDNSARNKSQNSLVRSITINSGNNTPYQKNNHLSKVWTITSGEGVFVINGREQTIKKGDTVSIPEKNFHAIKALTKLNFIEVQIGELASNDDIEISEWKWDE